MFFFTSELTTISFRSNRKVSTIMLNGRFVYPRSLQRPYPRSDLRWIRPYQGRCRIDNVNYITPPDSKPTKNRKKWKFKIIKFLIIFLCGIGCFYSIWLLSTSYFSYELITNISIKITGKIEMTAFSVCLYYPSILNHSSPKYFQFRHFNQLELQHTETILTLEDVFQMTPKLDNVISKCLYRQAKTFDVFKEEKSKCYEHFTVSKYYTVQFICFKFVPKKTANFSLLNIKFSLTNPGLFYQITLNKSLFANATVVQPMIYKWNGYPKSRFSTIVSNSPRGQINQKNQTLSNFHLSYYIINNELLPTPFATNCINYQQTSNFLDKSDCWEHCMKKLTIQTFNKLPFASIMEESVPLKLVTTSDFTNKTFQNLYRSLQKTCGKHVCLKNDCSQFMYVTTFIRREWTSDGLVFSVNTPQTPHFVTIFRPKWRLFNFVIDIITCFGNWFGLSFMDFTKIPSLMGNWN